MTAPLISPRRRGRPHTPVPDRETPGTCAICRRPLGKTANDRHTQPDPAAADLDARRLGERPTRGNSDA